ncbi:hypothetical protein FB1_21660 [Flavobacterium branchiophilum NBRC 15030 = ATCC 35035]|nr:hypothetical protein FB1_21660 [Flavobacterium branchiophilum NBRC 15030 = ATCC 35035]
MVILTACFCQAQQKTKKFTVEYLNMSAISITKNTEGYFSNYGFNESRSITNGFDVGISTLHGAKLFGYVSVMAGIGVDWNINKTFLATPFIVDLRLFSSKRTENSGFVYLQTGHNIKWNDTFNGDGVTAKMGIGGIFQYDGNTAYYIELYKKSRHIHLDELQNRGFYKTLGYGVSIGVIF